MRDTNDMMEDALSEDTMMDCGGHGSGLEDFVDLATDITNSSPNIRGAAERLLTLLGVDEDNEDLLSSSEDEGVEVDIDELEDDDDETETKLLHHLAVSLAQELKYSQKRSPSSSRTAHPGRSSVHGMEMLQDTSYLHCGYMQNQIDGPKTIAPVVRQNDFFVGDDERNATGRARFQNFNGYCQDRPEQHNQPFQPKDAASLSFPHYASLDRYSRMNDSDAAQSEKYYSQQQEQDVGSWAAGWDACASEALRYLVEDEGLPLQHPTVIAMKNHLDLQKERAFAQYTGYTETKSQDTNLILD